LKTVPEEKLKHVLNSISNLPTIKLGLLNYQPMIYLRDLKLNYYGMYIIYMKALFFLLSIKIKNQKLKKL